MEIDTVGNHMQARTTLSLLAKTNFKCYYRTRNFHNEKGPTYPAGIISQMHTHFLQSSQTHLPETDLREETEFSNHSWGF